MQSPPEPAVLPPVSPLAVEIAKLSGVAVDLLRRHVPDASGYCRGCRLPQSGFTRWPCTLFAAATAATRTERTWRLP